MQTGRNQAGNVANITANANRATQGLNAQDATMRQQNQRGVMSARQILAQAKQRAFDQEQQAIASLRGAGIQNFARTADIGLTERAIDANAGAEESNPLADLMAKRGLKKKMRFTADSINASPTDSYTI